MNPAHAGVYMTSIPRGVSTVSIETPFSEDKAELATYSRVLDK
jgi:hypothetical protein